MRWPVSSAAMGDPATEGGWMASTASRRAVRPIMADVARLAGVSHQTVSRVLNEHPNVSPQTRQDVMAAIRALGYRPNAAARSLVTRRTFALGVISFDTTLYGPASMLYCIERAARPDYSVAVTSLPALDRRSVLDAVDRLLRQAVEGIIVIAPQNSAVEALSGVTADVPLVAVGCGTRAPLASVAIDNMAGALAATRYLLSLGHRTVHHVGGPASWLDAQERVDGWRQALREAGAPQREPMCGDWSARSGYELGHQLADVPDVTAVFCANDQMALGLLRALSERAIRVPDDVSVVGFDDIPEAPYFLPPLTTVRQDIGELARRALGMIVDGINGGQAAAAGIPVAPDLIIRASATRPGH
jgi:DNA-binding LacI/PurR family transcriptional regulator